MPKSQDIDSYISQFPPSIQAKLETIRFIIHQQHPQLIETMSYGIPTIKLNKYIIHFSAMKSHIGIYPFPKTIEHFKDELALYQILRGTIRISFDQDIPLELIARMVRYNIKNQ